MEATNPVTELLERRCSTRSYAPTPITADERAVILHAAMRAPTAGNLMLYSIVEVDDPGLKARLAETCDDQPFIARAPLVLVFVADLQKWVDLFGAVGAGRLDEPAPSAAPVPGTAPGRGAAAGKRSPGPGDFVLACCDALIAAQNAVVAAESLGIGSCYIGDIVERGETHAELLALPRYTFPVTMLCFGRPKGGPHRTERYERHVVHRDAYRRLTPAELEQAARDLDELHGTRPGGAPGAFVRDVYRRKFTADFSAEADRSVAWWLDRWR